MDISQLGSLLTSSILLTGFVTALVIYLKKIPIGVAHLLKYFCIVQLHVNNNEQQAYDALAYWLSQNVKSKNLYVGSEQHVDWQMQPGYGWHYFRFRGCRILLHRKKISESEKKSWISQPLENFDLYGFNLNIMKEFLQQVKIEFLDKNNRVFVWHDYWQETKVEVNRPWSSVFFDRTQKQQIHDDILRFLNNEQNYINAGIPYRRSYVFYGPPGTGKTTLVKAISSTFQLPIYNINLSAIRDDIELMIAFSRVPSRSIILMEDIDTHNISQDRNQVDTDNSQQSIKKSITLSGLLNALDGVTTPNGVIVVMTTNHLHRLDPALLRAGRTDVKQYLGPVDYGVLIEYAGLYLEQTQLSSLEKFHSSKFIMSKIQDAFLKYQTVEELVQFLSQAEDK